MGQRRVGAPNDPNHLGVVIDAGDGPLDLIAPAGINIDGVPIADALGGGGGGAHPDLAAHDTLGLVTDALLTAHADDTTAVHGIADTAALALTSHHHDADYSELAHVHGAYVAVTAVPVVLTVALSDETTAITTGTAKLTMRMPFAMTLTAVRASLAVTSSSGIPTVDINETGTGTILSTKLTIDAGELTSTTAAVAAVISDTALADDAEITFDIDVAGTGAKGLKVSLIGTRSV